MLRLHIVKVLVTLCLVWSLRFIMAFPAFSVTPSDSHHSISLGMACATWRQVSMRSAIMNPQMSRRSERRDGCNAKPAATGNQAGPVRYKNCDKDELMNYARQVAQENGKKEVSDKLQRKFCENKDYANFLEKTEGLWGPAKKSSKIGVVTFSKTVTLDDGRECRVVIKMPSRRLSSSKGGQAKSTTFQKNFLEAFVAMGLSFV